MVTNEMIRLLVRWYGVSEASAVEIIGELRDLSVLLCLASGRMVRARAVGAITTQVPPPKSYTG
jgi:hypothetical protein